MYWLVSNQISGIPGLTTKEGWSSSLYLVTMFSQVIVPTMEKIKLEAIENSLFELS